MHPSFLAVLPAVAALSYTGVHYGQQSTEATLFQLPMPTSSRIYPNHRATGLQSIATLSPDADLHSSNISSPGGFHDTNANLLETIIGPRDESDDDEDTSWASFEPDDDEDEEGGTDDESSSDESDTSVESDGSLFDYFENLKISGDDSEDDEDYGKLTAGDLEVIAEGKNNDLAGIMQLDCKIAPEACKNACYYEKCMRKSDNVVYEWGGGDDDAQDHNRVQSGVTINWGTPCRTWPFAQRFWDRYNWRKPPVTVAKIPKGTDSDLFLQTDEWPMASMMNADFEEDSDPPQVSLRCIRASDNGRGGGMLKSFANVQAAYAPPQLNKDGTVKKKQTPATRGIWQSHHYKQAALEKGDKFKVNFNFDSFARPGEPDYKEDQKIRE